MHSHARTIVFSTLIVACVLPSFVRRCAAQAASSTPAQGIVPPDLPYAAEFVNVLQRTGVVVVDIRSDPSFAKLFEDAEHAVYILTNLGAVEVAIFKGDKDAESITVTYGKTLDSRPIHSYDFCRPKGNKVGSATSSNPLYFTLHNRWFIETLSAQLDFLMKQALGQAETLNR